MSLATRISQPWRCIPYYGLLLAVTSGIAFQAPAARAVESVQLTYGSLQMRSLPLEDFEALVTSNRASREIQSLLDLLKIENTIAQAVLGAEWDVDRQVFDRAVNSFVGNAFFELVAGALELPDSDIAGWLALRNAAIAAAADGKVSVIEVLQNLEGRLLIIDAREAISVARDLRQDVESIRALFNPEADGEEVTTDGENRRDFLLNR
ncbi:hypothetical protein C7271_08160 [filamentous cyanobacterium CCP5]|nr:hypothetical protein C7271_08160 [filamentous cyanobacterium CCP5]